MKSTLILSGILLVTCSLAVELPALPGATFADTEVSTNFPLVVGAVANRKLVFTLELRASALRTRTSSSSSYIFSRWRCMAMATASARFAAPSFLRMASSCWLTE